MLDKHETIYPNALSHLKIYCAGENWLKVGTLICRLLQKSDFNFDTLDT